MEAEPGDQGVPSVPPSGRFTVVPVADLRRFMATQMLEAGVPIVTVSRRLAHRRVSTTMDQYAHSVPGGDAQASAVLRAVIETATNDAAATPTVAENDADESDRDGTWPAT